ncbi:hypothetical protein [Phreatobacter oligotrophus]|uniref:Uncharacterized protein n=1 Tax=Phreatobacter oligotrophus TaxID=1122261 RepID=A0A2T4YX10_9HYPH|nr:hypothetical protein [Phreatobacter oligotrophus]PTM49897.1 hypothetical protein C8P69_11611 [Phreatobacter oligotrophus]
MMSRQNEATTTDCRIEWMLVAAASLGGASVGMLIALILDVEEVFETSDYLTHAVTGGCVGAVLAAGLFGLVRGSADTE